MQTLLVIKLHIYIKLGTLLNSLTCQIKSERNHDTLVQKYTLNMLCIVGNIVNYPERSFNFRQLHNGCMVNSALYTTKLEQLISQVLINFHCLNLVPGWTQSSLWFSSWSLRHGSTAIHFISIVFFLWIVKAQDTNWIKPFAFLKCFL